MGLVHYPSTRLGPLLDVIDVVAHASLACATAGDLTGFRHARDATLTHLDHPPAVTSRQRAGPPTCHAPNWGRSPDATLATRLPNQHDALLAEAERLLRGRADTDPTSVPQRSALRHGVLLAAPATSTKPPPHARRSTV